VLIFRKAQFTPPPLGHRDPFTQDMPSIDIFSYMKLIFVSSDIRRIFLFMKHEKKGRCFFANSSKWYV
jgi:hypothetical protein